MRTIALIIALFSFSCSAQQTGFFGKKTVIELNAQGAFPLFNNTYSSAPIYKVSSNGNLVRGNNTFDGGFHAGISHALSRKFALGVEFNFNRQEIHPASRTNATFESSNGGTTTQSINARFENVDFDSRTLLFKFEFSGKNSLLPVGISHQIGFGISRMNIVDKDYVEQYLFNSQQASLTLVSVEDLDDQLRFARVYRGSMIMYRINFRTAVSRSLVLNYGTQFTLNLTPSSNVDDSARRLIRRKRIRSVAQLYFGLGFVF